jgi:hypothetical protein
MGASPERCYTGRLHSCRGQGHRFCNPLRVNMSDVSAQRQRKGGNRADFWHIRGPFQNGAWTAYRYSDQATGWTTGESRFNSRKVKTILSSPKPKQSLTPTQLPLKEELGVLSPGVERPKRQPDHSTPPNAEVKKGWSHTSAPPYTFTAYLRTTLPSPTLWKIRHSTNNNHRLADLLTQTRLPCNSLTCLGAVHCTKYFHPWRQQSLG